MQKRSSIIGGIILISVGLIILLFQLIPGLSSILDLGQHWPFIFLVIGGFFLLGALSGTPDMAIPGTIIMGLGLIFYYQNISGNWASWAYVWTLIPGFVGIGMLLSSVIDKTKSDMRREGKRLILISGGLFIVFAFFFTGGWQLLRFWPLLLIVAGIVLLLRNRSTQKSEE